MARKAKKLQHPKAGARLGTIYVSPVREDDARKLRWQLALDVPAKTWPIQPVVGTELHREVFFDDADVAAESARASAQRLIEEGFADIVYVAVHDQYFLKKTQEYVVRREGF